MCSNFAQKILLLHYWVSPKDFIQTSVDLYFFEVPEKSEINQEKSIVLYCYFDNIFGGEGNEWIKFVLFFCI